MNEPQITNQNISSQAGFTLVELIVYVGVSTVIIGMTILAGVAASNVRTKALAKHEANYNYQFAVEKISHTVRRAEDIDEGASTFDVHPGVLVLEMEDATEDPIVFDVSGGALRMKQGSASPVNITSDRVHVTDFRVENFSSGNKMNHVRLHVTVEHNNPGGIQAYQAEISGKTSVSIRRKSL